MNALTAHSEDGNYDLRDAELLDLCGQIACIWLDQGVFARADNFAEFAAVIEEATNQTGHYGYVNMSIDDSVDAINLEIGRKDKDRAAVIEMYESLIDQLAGIESAYDATDRHPIWNTFKERAGKIIDAGFKPASPVAPAIHEAA